MTRDEILAICVEAANSAGIPPLLLVACGVAESNLNPDARRPSSPGDDQRYWSDVSFGLFQQTVRWSAEYLKERSKAGADAAAFPGSGTIETIGQLYTDPEYAAEVAAANLKGKYRSSDTNAVFKALCRYNWPAGDGEPASAATAANYRRGIAEAERLLGNSITVPEKTQESPNYYNPDAAVDLQPDDWSCSVQSAQWLLRSLGRNPGDAWLEQQLVGPLFPGSIVTREYGLMDSSGKTLAAWLQKEYGDEMGLTFEAKQNVTWEQVTALAGKQPVALGGRTYGHWTGVRRMANGGLELANPAPNWKGVGSVMDQDEFAALGSWSLITAAVPAPGVGTGPSSTSDEDTILGLRRAVAHLVDVVLPKAAAAAAEREAALAEALRIREEFVGKKPAA